MLDDSISDDNTANKKNKGVNVGPDVLSAAAAAGAHRYPDATSSSTSTNHPSRSLTDIKNEIQTVLELMGPSTPTLSGVQNTSSEADNEDSFSSASSKVKDKRCSKECSSSERNNSVLADAGTLSSLTICDNFDNVTSCPCYDRVESQFIKTPNTCMCMINYARHKSKDDEVNYLTPNQCASSNSCKKNRLFKFLTNNSFDLLLKKSNHNPCQLYKINISGQDEGAHPKRVVFDLVDGIPKPCSNTVATNTVKTPVEKFKTNFSMCSNKCDDQLSSLNCDCKESKNLKNVTMSRKSQQFDSCHGPGHARIDYYYFDHGNAQYFNTTDSAPVMVCEIIAEKTEKYTTKFWAEFFASIHIVISFGVSFILQLFKFILYSLMRPLIVGSVQMASDYFFKPFLTTLFNGLIQPCLIFFYNIASSIRDLCNPIAEGVGYFLGELAVLFRAIRLCTYKKNVEDNCECTRKNKCNFTNKKHKCEC